MNNIVVRAFAYSYDRNYCWVVVSAKDNLEERFAVADIVVVVDETRTRLSIVVVAVGKFDFVGPTKIIIRTNNQTISKY